MKLSDICVEVVVLTQDIPRFDITELIRFQRYSKRLSCKSVISALLGMCYK